MKDDSSGENRKTRQLASRSLFHSVPFVCSSDLSPRIIDIYVDVWTLIVGSLSHGITAVPIYTRIDTPVERYVGE